MKNYCTYFDWAYIKQGLVLHASMERHCQPYHLWILALCDESWNVLTRLLLPNVTVVRISAVETGQLQAARSTRTWQEYIWTLTGSWMLYGMNRHGLDHINYIDADLYFFASPEPIFEEIGDAPLGITPHRFAPQHRNFEVNGLYNVGLVYAVKRAIPCIKEWADKCIDWCYYRSENGKYADQKYLDEWPEKWGAHSVRHLGANLAPWNQLQYEYNSIDGRIFVEHDPLLWYHFHQGLEPKWEIHPFVRAHIYPRYEKALRQAEGMLC